MSPNRETSKYLLQTIQSTEVEVTLFALQDNDECTYGWGVGRTRTHSRVLVLSPRVRALSTCLTLEVWTRNSTAKQRGAEEEECSLQSALQQQHNQTARKV